MNSSGVPSSNAVCMWQLTHCFSMRECVALSKSLARRYFAFLGLAVGWWLFIIGASIGVVGLVGWTFEYFKGEHAL